MMPNEICWQLRSQDAPAPASKPGRKGRNDHHHQTRQAHRRCVARPGSGRASRFRRYRPVPGLQQGAGSHARLSYGPRNQGDDRGGTALSRKKRAAKPPKEGLVIDSSTSIAWCFPDKQDDYSQTVLDALASEQALVPELWHLEVANTLLVGERRKLSTQVRTDNASLICFRQRIAQFSSSQTAGASLRLVAEVTPVGDVEAVVGCVFSAGRNRERVPVAMRETSQNAGKTGVALADCLPRSSLASHAPDGQGGLEPPPTGVESGGSG